MELRESKFQQALPVTRRNCYGKNERLRRAAEIISVLKSKYKCAAKEFAFKWRFRSGASDETRAAGPRLCVVIKKSAIKKASQRNRMKRLTREFFRRHKHRMPERLDLMVFANAYRPLKYREVELLFESKLNQVGILK